MKPKYGDSYPEEFVLAMEQKRIPRCVSCKKDLKQITQTQYEYITWEWDGDEYVQVAQSGYGGDSDDPKCPHCGYGEADMLDMNSGISIGVDY